MTTIADSADPMHDEVLWLGIELAAVAKPRDAAAFKTLLMRFTEAVVREAFEHQAEIRARLGMLQAFDEAGRVRERIRDASNDADTIEALKAGLRACPYCGVEVPTMDGHECERMRELGFVDARNIPRNIPSAACLSDSSTGAAEAETKAAHTHNVAPTAETPAAPSTERCDECEAEHGHLHHPNCARAAPASLPAPSAAERPAAAPSREGAGSATGGAATPSRLHDTSEDGRPGSNKRGSTPCMTPEQKAQLRAEHAAACSANGGATPYGWFSRKAREIGLAVSTVHRFVNAADDSRPVAHKVVHAECEQEQRPAREVDEHAEPEREVVQLDTAGRVHTNSNACWCRKGANKAGNYWCKNAPEPPIMPGLRSRVPPTARNERFAGTMARAPHIRDVE